MTGLVTIGDLIHDRRLLWVYCGDCGREQDVDPASLPLPPDFPVPEVGKHMKCSACGSRKITTRPELYPGGIETMRSCWRGRGTREEATMAFTIVILQGEQELSRTPFDGDSGAAKTLAIEQCKAQYEQQNATSLRVIDTDDNDHVVFSYSEDVHVPRTGA